MIDLAIDSRIFIDSVLDAALQELDMIFNTTNTELIGYPMYGTNWEQFLWQMTPSPNELRRYIVEKMSQSFFLAEMDTNVDVQVLEGEFRAIYYVKITVKTKSGKIGYREYQFR